LPSSLTSYSGPDEVFTMRERVDPGKSCGPLDQAIEARYPSRFDFMNGLKNAFGGRPAVVQKWGQR
jgi:hypothetical protein